MFVKIILTILMAMQPHKDDTESITEKKARKTIIAQSIVEAANRFSCSGKWKIPECKKKWFGTAPQLAIAMLAHGESETHYSERIHKGFCKRNECDPAYVLINGKRVLIFRARNVFQVHATATTQKVWDNALGATLKATTNAAYIQAYYFTLRYCGGNVVYMFESQSGKGCKDGKLGRKKAKLYWKYLAMYNKKSQEYAANKN